MTYKSSLGREGIIVVPFPLTQHATFLKNNRLTAAKQMDCTNHWFGRCNFASAVPVIRHSIWGIFCWNPSAEKDATASISLLPYCGVDFMPDKRCPHLAHWARIVLQDSVWPDIMCLWTDVLP